MVQAAVRERGSRDDQRTVGRWLFVAASLLVLSVVLTTTWRWIHADRALAACCSDRSGGVVSTGRTIYFGDAAEPAGNQAMSLDLRSVRPEVVENSAGAAVRVLVCSGRHGPRSPGPTESIDPAVSCTRLTPFRPGTVRLGGGSGLVIAVTPLHIGTVRILGSTVVYRDGLRRGTQRTGLDLSVRVRSVTDSAALAQ